MLVFKNIWFTIWLLLLFQLHLVYGNVFYPISYPDRILLEENNIVVGARNSIVRLNTQLSEVINEQDLTPSEYDSNQCLINGWPTDDCNNDVCIILTPTSDQLIPGSSKKQNTTILTCTTNAYSPVCTFRDTNTFESLYSFNGDQFISSDKNYQSAHLFTSDGDLFTYRQEGLGDDYVITKHKQPLSDNSYVRTRNYFKTSLWLKEAEVVSMYEEGDFVYTFLREKAVEVTTRISQNEIVYSRVARICKNDLGSGSPENHFLSFQKARISCVYQQTSQTPAYHYNEIQDTFKLMGSYAKSSPFEQVYAVFSSPVNGPIGSAVCVYTFDENNFDLVKAFRGKYINELAPYSWGFSEEKGNIDCQANPIRTTKEAKRNVIMQFSVEQAHQSDPLFFINNQKFLKIVVDRVRTIEGDFIEMMFILAISYQPTIDIMLHRVTYNPWRNIKSKLISTNTVVRDTSDLYVTEMKLYKNAINQSEEGILIGIKSGIFKIPLHSCSNYKSSKECVGSMDPYCVYSCKQQQCVSIYNLNHSGDHFLYNYTNGFLWNCPIKFIPEFDTIPVTTTYVMNSTFTTTTTTTAKIITKITESTTDIFPLLIPLSPIPIEYLILSLLASSMLFCLMGILISLCYIKISLFLEKRRHLDYIRTETDTFASQESSPIPKQFWEPTTAVMPYEVPTNNNYNKYKPSHLQSSPAINGSNYSTYALNSHKSWLFGSSILNGSLVKNKFASTTITRSHSPGTSGLPPLPPRKNSNGFLFHPTLNPPNRPNSASAFHQQQLSNQYKRYNPDNRTFTPDFLSIPDRGSKSEI